jgi:hypothetical protein
MDTYVTGANPAPGQTKEFVYFVPSGNAFVDLTGTRTDNGVGVNTYIAGGTGPNGEVIVSGNLGINLSGVQISGIMTVIVSSSITGNITSIPASTTGAVLHAANTSRQGLTVFNASNGILYLCLNSTGTTITHTVPVVVSGYYEIPFKYNGPVYGVAASGASGSWLVTELQ